MNLLKVSFIFLVIITVSPSVKEIPINRLWSIHYGIGLTYFNLLLVVLISISFNYSKGVYSLLISNGYIASSAISRSSYVYLFSLPAKLK